MKSDFDVLMEISETDLLASEKLFDLEFYPQSLFYLQQSSEKLVKWIGLSNKIIEKTDLLKKIGHNSNLIYKKAASKFQDRFPQKVDFDVNDEFSNLSNFISNSSIETVVQSLVNQIKEILENKYPIPFDLNNLKTIENFYELMQEIDPNNPQNAALINSSDSPALRTHLNKMVEEFSNDIIHYNHGVLILLCINTLTERLATSVRYPKIDDMINPGDIFTKMHPIVISLPIFHKAMHFSLTVIRKTNN